MCVGSIKNQTIPITEALFLGGLEMQEKSYDQRRVCWEWDAEERRRTLELWDADNQDNRTKKADVTIPNKQGA